MATDTIDFQPEEIDFQPETSTTDINSPAGRAALLKDFAPSYGREFSVLKDLALNPLISKDTPVIGGAVKNFEDTLAAGESPFIFQSPALRSLSGVARSLTGAAEGFTSPAGVITSLAGAAPRVVRGVLSAAFGVLGAKGAYDASHPLVQAVKARDWGKAAELATDIVSGGAQAALGAHGAIESFRPPVPIQTQSTPTKPNESETNPIQNRPAEPGQVRQGREPGDVNPPENAPPAAQGRALPVTPAEIETPNASNQPQATEVHGAVRPPSGQGEGQVPEPPGSAGIQPPVEDAKGPQGEVSLTGAEAPLTEVAQSKPPVEASAAPVKNFVQQLSEHPLGQSFGKKFSTNTAMEYGANLDPAQPGQLEELKQAEASYQAQFAELQKTPLTIENMPERQAVQLKKQLFTEAIQAATGQGVEKGDVARQILGPDYEPPFPGGKPRSSTVDKSGAGSQSQPMSATANRASIVSEHEQASAKALSKNKAIVEHLEQSEDGPEIWTVSSDAKGNDNHASVYKLPDGRYRAEDSNGMSLGTGKTPEEALSDAKDYVESGETQEGYNLNAEARSKLLQTIDLPKDFSIADIQDTKYGSVYYKLRQQTGVDADGEPEYENYKVSIRNHEPSPFREKEFGASDYWVEVPKDASPQDLHNAIGKIETWLQKKAGRPVSDKATKMSLAAAATDQSESRQISTGGLTTLSFGSKNVAPVPNTVGSSRTEPNKAGEIAPPNPLIGQTPEGLPGQQDAIKPSPADIVNEKTGPFPPGAKPVPTVVNPSVSLEAAGPGSTVIGPGMGGALPEEIPPQGPRESGTPSVHGVATRVLEQRRLAGEIAPIEAGHGISAEGSVERGRQLLPQADPEKIMSDFEKTKRFSADDLSVARARGEKLAQAALKAYDEHGLNSPQYEKAWEADSAWSKRLKDMSTEWHKSGMAQQGETEIDTGTFHGLRKAYFDLTGKDFTPEQAGQAQQTADRVKKANGAAQTAEQNLFKHLKQESSGQTDAEKAALDAAAKAVRDAAVRRAEAERKLQVSDAARNQAAAKVQADAEKRALDVANKTVRDAAARRAEAENQRALKVAVLRKKAAQVEVETAIKAQNVVDEIHRDLATRAAQLAAKKLNDPQWHVWEKVKDYIAKGTESFDDIRNKIATDLGMKVEKVTRLIAQAPRAKRLANDVWHKQQAARLVKEQAKRWLTNLSVPGYQKALQSIPRALFSLKVGFHGTVALGTHAPMVAFQPRFWKTYITDFARMYKMVGRPAYYERQIQDLVRRPNYTIARRAGLVNDPTSYEEYANIEFTQQARQTIAKIAPQVANFFNQATGMGNRGYAVLKILRQDMFDQQWSQLPKTAQIPEVAQAIADGINHATGVVKGKAPPGSNLALFAPRLEASRIAWLVVDPVKAARTFADWKNAGPGERQFALNQVKEKAWVAGTLFGLLALNQGVLSATGSNQKINFSDPMKSDFLKFKAAGMDLSYGNAMLAMARLPVRLYAIRSSHGGKLRNIVFADENTYTVLGEYARSQESPAASLATDIWLKSDWMNRQLPGSGRPEPARLRRQGIKPYTWTEFLSEQGLPIPAEEAMREVWKHGLGMSDEQIKSMRKAMATIAVMSATGARLTDDVSAKKSANKPFDFETAQITPPSAPPPARP